MHYARFIGSLVVASAFVMVCAEGSAMAGDAKLAPAKKTADKPTDADDGSSAAEDKPLSVAPLLGYATQSLKLGVGARVGYTLPQHVYIGGTFMYHFGTSDETTVAGKTVGASVSLFYPAAEVGYDVHVGEALIRPYAGVGVLFAHASVSGLGGTTQSATDSSMGIYPGVTASYEIPKSPAFVGADLRLLFATRGGDPSFGAFLTGGVRF
jgi:hypothetical protein